MPPIDLGSSGTATQPSDLVRAILKAADKQVAQKTLPDAEAREEFMMSSDALNYWRLEWRCAVEWHLFGFPETVKEAVQAGICRARAYDRDDFESALEATKGRPRFPFGWTALDLAWAMSKREPITLLNPALSGRRIPTAIAGIAYHLQSIQGNSPILLPIEQLRSILQQRKIVVSGAVQRLVDAGLIEYVTKDFHTGRAREFRFSGVKGEHFDMQQPDPLGRT